MTREELLLRSGKAALAMQLMAGGLLAAFLVTAFIVLFPWQTTAAEAHHPGASVVLAGAIAADIAVLWYLNKVTGKNLGLICPHCSRVFPAIRSRRIIEAGRCPECGQKVYDETHA